LANGFSTSLSVAIIRQVAKTEMRADRSKKYFKFIDIALLFIQNANVNNYFSPILTNFSNISKDSKKIYIR
jgi:hypothetical protein